MEPELVYKTLGPQKLISDLNRIKKNSWVFVCDMGDLFCENKIIKANHITWVINAMSRRDELKYLLVTKNPKGYMDFAIQFSENTTTLGTTIETNKNEIIRKYSKAPSTYNRYKALKKLSFARKFVGLEPLFDFDLDVLLNWLIEINPEIIAVGFDEHKRSMKRTLSDRPPPDKVLKLLSSLKTKFKQFPEKRIYLNGEIANIYFGKTH